MFCRCVVDISTDCKPVRIVYSIARALHGSSTFPAAFVRIPYGFRMEFRAPQFVCHPYYFLDYRKSTLRCPCESLTSSVQCIQNRTGYPTAPVQLPCGVQDSLAAYTRAPCDWSRENLKAHRTVPAKYVTATQACHRTLQYPEIVEFRRR
jgi:hypothetical protein